MSRTCTIAEMKAKHAWGQTDMSAATRVREIILSFCLAFVNPHLGTVLGSPEENSGRLKRA